MSTSLTLTPQAEARPLTGRDLQVAVAMSCLYVLYAVCWLPTKALQRVFRR